MVGGRPDLLVLATPLVGIAVWSVMVRPVVIPTTRVRLGHTTVREGQAAALHVALDCDDGRVDDVSVMIRGRHPGDLGRIAVCALQGHLWLEDCEADPHGVTLRLRTPNGRHDVVALWVEHPE